MLFVNTPRSYDDIQLLKIEMATYRCSRSVELINRLHKSIVGINPFLHFVEQLYQFLVDAVKDISPG